MIDRQITLDKVIATAVWASTGLVLGVAITVMAMGYWRVSILIAEAACILSAYAAVRSVRCYMIRLAALVRGIAEQAEPRAGIPVQRIH